MDIISETRREVALASPLTNPIDLKGEQLEVAPGTRLLTAGRGSVSRVKGKTGSSQIVKTSDGHIVYIPQMIGSSTKVEALDDGKYKVTTKGSKYGSIPKVEILTENELVNRFDPSLKTGKKLNIGV